VVSCGAAPEKQSLNEVVQYHRRMRLHMAPVKPQLNWTTAKWTVLGAWLPLILANGIAVVPSGMDGIRVSQTSGTRPGILYPGVLWVTPLGNSGFRRKSKRDLPPPGQARSGGSVFLVPSVAREPYRLERCLFFWSETNAAFPTG